MEQKIDIGLNSKINEFASKFNLNRTDEKDEDIFEHFANYIYTSNVLEEELENINSVSTNQAQGIDGIVITINNRLVTEEADLLKLGENEKFKVSFSFIQSTIQKSFDEKKFQAFVDEVVNFLCGTNRIEPFSTIFEKIMDEEGDLIEKLEDTPSVSLFFISGRTNHNYNETSLEYEKRKITNRKELEGKLILDNIHFHQKEKIKEQYDNIARFHSAQLKFDKNIQLDELPNIEFSLLATIKFSELKKLILTSNDEKLRERLFIENVRNFIGDTPVNKDIKGTLNNDTQRIYFPFLNNGLTIMCDTIEKHRVKQNEFILTYPRIINGCQTTHILVEKYRENPEIVDNVEVVAKVIATTDNNLKKQIIFAANNQNSIDKDLQSLNQFHEKIETYFSGFESNIPIYFERLRGQFSQINPPYSRINIENLAKVYISIFLCEPHKMKSNAIKRIEEYQKNKKIFKETDKESDYYYAALLFYYLNYFTINSELTLKSKTMDMHLLMACDLELKKKGFNSSSEKIKELLRNLDDTRNLFSHTNQFLNSETYLFDRRGFYSAPKTRLLIEKYNS